MTEQAKTDPLADPAIPTEDKLLMLHHHLVRERFFSAACRLIVGLFGAFASTIAYVVVSTNSAAAGLHEHVVPGLTLLTVIAGAVLAVWTIFTIQPYRHLKQLKKVAEEELSRRGHAPLPFRLFYNERGEVFYLLAAFALVVTGTLINPPWSLAFKFAGMVGLIHACYRIAVPPATKEG